MIHARIFVFEHSTRVREHDHHPSLASATARVKHQTRASEGAQYSTWSVAARPPEASTRGRSCVLLKEPTSWLMMHKRKSPFTDRKGWNRVRGDSISVH